jgi:hypothetical protein
MKTTSIVIQNEADHSDAKHLIEKLMGSSDSQDRARMVAQASLGRGLRAHAVAAYGANKRIRVTRCAFDGAKRIRVRASAQLLEQCREFRLLR